MAYGRSRNTRKAAPRRKPYNKAPAKKRRMTGGSFAAQVKKANLSSAQSKNISVCFTEHELRHNQWYKGLTQTTGSNPILYHHKFENMIAQIGPGTEDHQRVGDEIYVDRLSLRLFLSSPAKEGSCITYRIIVYCTPNAVPGSTGDPMLLKDNVDPKLGFNNLLRSVDKRGAHVLFEKLIIPGKNGILANSHAVSQIEELNVSIKRNVSFQSHAVTYGAKGGWTNLHVAVLAYDSSLMKVPVSDAAMEVETAEGLGMGVGGVNPGNRAIVSTAAIANVGCEYTLYYKEA